MKVVYPIFCICLSLFFNSCDKNQNNSNKLMKGEVWQVEYILIDGENQVFKGRWQIIQDVDIYENVPSALWRSEGQEKVFYWQFRNKGKTFEILPDTICNGSVQDLCFFSYSISGEYLAKRHSKKKMIFSSSNTKGFPGKLVEISIGKIPT